MGDRCIAAGAGVRCGDGSMADRDPRHRSPRTVLRPDRRGDRAQRATRRARFECASAARGGRGGNSGGRGRDAARRGRTTRQELARRPAGARRDVGCDRGQGGRAPSAPGPKCSQFCSHVVSNVFPRSHGRGRHGSQTAENPAFAGLSDAPREIRTPTVQTDHKALNLARRLPVLSYRRRIALSIREGGRFGPGGRGVCCHGVVTGETFAVVPGCSITRRGDTRARGTDRCLASDRCGGPDLTRV